MTNQDFLDELEVLNRFFEGVRDFQLIKSGVSTTGTSAAVMVSGTVSTTQTTLSVQRTITGFESVSEEQLLCESIVYQLNSFWGRYAGGFILKTRQAECAHLFPAGGTDFQGTGELRELTNVLKHQNKLASNKLARLRQGRFSRGTHVDLRYSDADYYIDMVKRNVQTLGSQKIPAGMPWYKIVLAKNKKEIKSSAIFAAILAINFSLWRFVAGKAFEWASITPLSAPPLIYSFYSALVFVTLGYLLYKIRFYKLLAVVFGEILGDWKAYRTIKVVIWGCLILIAYYLLQKLIDLINQTISFFYNVLNFLLYLAPPLGITLIVFLIFLLWEAEHEK